MKNLFISFLPIIALLLLVNNSFCQSKFRADISMGLVNPIGNFKKSDINLASSGYATNGFTLNVEGDYYMHNRLALSLRFHFGNSPIDQNKFEGWLKNSVASYLTYPDSAQYRINYWQWASPLLGLKYNYPIQLNKFYVEAGLFTGVSFNQIPDQGLLYNDKENKRNIISENVDRNTISVPFSATVAFRFRINKSLELKLESSFFGTNVSYQHVSYIVSDNETEEIERIDFNIPIKTINTTIGLVYWL